MLELTVSYSGGCEEHDFSLCWNGEILDYFIPEVQIAIGHDARDDMCEAYPTETLRFDAAVPFNTSVLKPEDTISALYSGPSESE